jgi:glycosyltransferase involved in cell wall biosynthesis
MIRNSDHIITLTENAKKILYNSYLENIYTNGDNRITVIPTCADIELFNTKKISTIQRNTLRRALDIGKDDLVMGYLGTFHSDYLPSEMFRAFSILRLLKPGAKFLFVTPNSREEIIKYAVNCGLNEIDIRVVMATRMEVPSYVSIFDLSLIFIRPDKSTAGVFPTKLAELFACNIPLLVNAGVGDLDVIVRPEVNDSVLLQDFSDSCVKDALIQLLGIIDLPTRRGRVCSNQFSLSEGIKRYKNVYSKFQYPEEPLC